MNIEVLFFAGGFGLVLLMLVFAIIATSRQKAAVKEWRSTLGMITASALERRSRGTNRGYANYAAVRYSYQVGGQTYQGTCFDLGSAVSGKGAKKVIARYPVGAEVMVFYNPQNPSEAVLERRNPTQWVWWFIAIVFACTFYNIVGMMIQP